MTTTQEEKTTSSDIAQQIVESPFLSQKAFTRFEEDSEQPEEENLIANSVFAESPFPSIFEMENENGSTDPEAEELVTFLNELNDDEFDDAVNQVIGEAEGLLHNRFDTEFADPISKVLSSKRMLEAHIDPLVREAEQYLDGLALELEQYDIEKMSEEEFYTLVDRYDPSYQELSPAFENFFGKLKKKFKKAVKKGFRAAKRGVESVVKRGIQAAKKMSPYDFFTNRGRASKHNEVKMMHQSKFFSKLQLCVVGVALVFGNTVSADDVDCTPTRVRAANDRIDTRCVGIDRWFVAMRATANPEHLNQMIALLNSAIVSGKPVKLYYNPVDNKPTSNGNLFAVELFR